MSKNKTLYAKFKKTLKHGIVYGLGSSAHLFLSFILLPLYTRQFDVAEYGTLGLLNTTGNMAGIIMHAGLSVALFRSYFEYPAEKERRMVVTTAMVLLLALSLLPLAGGLFFAPQISQLLFHTEAYTISIRLLLLFSLFNQLNRGFNAILRALNKSLLYTVLQVLSFTLGISIIIYFVKYRNQGIQGVMMGNCIMSGLLLVTLAVLLRNTLSWAFSFSEARRMLLYGLPLIVAGLSSFAFNSLDRYMLNYLADRSQLGLYNLGYQFGMIMMVALVNPMKAIWAPMAISVKNDDNAMEFYARMLTYYIFMACALFLCLSLFGREVIQLFAQKEYWPAYSIVPVIALAYMLIGTRSILDIGLFLKRKTHISALYFLFGAVCNYLLNTWLIPLYGYHGAAVATLLSFVIVVGVSIALNKRYIAIRYEWGRIAKILVAGALVFGAGYSLDIPSLAGAVAIKIIFIGIFPVLIYLLRFFTPSEKIKIAVVLKKLGFAGPKNA